MNEIITQNYRPAVFITKNTHILHLNIPIPEQSDCLTPYHSHRQFERIYANLQSFVLLTLLRVVACRHHRVSHLLNWCVCKKKNRLLKSDHFGLNFFLHIIFSLSTGSILYLHTINCKVNLMWKSKNEILNSDIWFPFIWAEVSNVNRMLRTGSFYREFKDELRFLRICNNKVSVL